MHRNGGTHGGDSFQSRSGKPWRLGGDRATPENLSERGRFHEGPCRRFGAVRRLYAGDRNEIFGEPGVTFSGYLPDEFKLETVYSAGVCRSAADEILGRKFVSFVTGEASRSSRAAAGFL